MSSISAHTGILKPALDFIQLFLPKDLHSAEQWIDDNPEMWAIDRQVHYSTYIISANDADI